MVKVTIVNYGVGNILSVTRAFDYCGAKVILADTPKQIRKADYLVLPGVGAFADGMQGLKQRGFIEPICEFAHSGNPLLGICLGMQMLLDNSEEFGNHEGLGLIQGRVKRLPMVSHDGLLHKVPNIGWYELEVSSYWGNTVLSRIEEGEAVYFVHSFVAEPIEQKHRLANYDYDGHKIAAVICSGNIYGCQFHPEKSGEVGLRIIKSFIEIC